MADKGKIEGGYYLVARKIFESGIMDKPPMWLKILHWIYGQARFSGGRLKRGQLRTTYANICHFNRCTKSTVDHFLRWARGKQILATQKATHGMVITVVNYDYYQNPANYESDNKGASKATQKRHRSDNIDKNVIKGKNGNNIYVFEIARKLYPGTKRGLEPEYNNFKKKYPNWTEILPLLKPAIERQKQKRKHLKSAGKFVPEWPHFQTWINNERWTEEEGAEVSPEEIAERQRLAKEQSDRMEAIANQSREKIRQRLADRTSGIFKLKEQ